MVQKTRRKETNFKSKALMGENVTKDFKETEWVRVDLIS
jgi:hypothetical protein